MIFNNAEASTSTSTQTTPAQGVKRKRHTRTSTGCRACRMTRVKCPEGPVNASGTKAACRRCWENDEACFYPSRNLGGRMPRKGMRERDASWEAAGPYVGNSGEVVAGPAATSSGPDDNRPVIKRARVDTKPPAHAAIAALLRFALAPHAPLATFTLASLAPSEADAHAISFFEARGCVDILSAPGREHNWIWTQLFPRLVAVLLHAHPMRSYLHACLLQLAYTHRANMEDGETQRAVWRSQATQWRTRAGAELVRVKLTRKEWKGDEYLMGLFIRYMADMLSGGGLDPIEPEVDVTATCPSLRSMISTYATMQSACGARKSSPTIPDDEDPEWVERFFGFSPAFTALLARVNSLVADKLEGHRPMEVRLGAHALLDELGEGWEVGAVRAHEVGKSARVQRGNEVMRAALRVLLLSEVLQVPLHDARIERCARRAVELVADSDAASMPGFQWPLVIVAVYTRDVALRARLQELITHATALSFGPHYPAPRDVLEICWELMDSSGYVTGVAPWRDAAASVGRTLWV
ncbi:uncharacterized protein LOC62_03G003965 [Vanrija pseudolonga]|uniref:Zn(2)-C6 fungal-type domain-containing protein n=1 Tax=Vanrija pseudolonga TaxID=143232 RepID=A0AAF0Y9V4_9TREE|nr:hypothetical protein LOC62_03G003965 [Vanrija pseudolonga]